jgi:hypothetical protein
VLNRAAAPLWQTLPIGASDGPGAGLTSRGDVPVYAAMVRANRTIGGFTSGGSPLDRVSQRRQNLTNIARALEPCNPTGGPE